MLFVAACQSGGGGGGTIDAAPDDFSGPGLNPDRGETVPTVRFYVTAEENFIEAQRRFEKRDYLAAQQYFSYIRTKFPYSRYAVASDLRTADCQFEREHWLEAIDSYQNFVRLHPGHPDVPYAVFQTAAAYYEQIPSDFFLIPPSAEKDQTAVKDAQRNLQAYLQRYPQGEQAERAAEMYSDIQQRLIDHELAVARFYSRIGKYRGYVNRLEVVRSEFGPADAELLADLARGYAELGEVDQVRALFQQMEDQAPDAKELSRRVALEERALERKQELAEKERKVQERKERRGARKSQGDAPDGEDGAPSPPNADDESSK